MREAAERARRARCARRVRARETLRAVEAHGVCRRALAVGAREELLGEEVVKVIGRAARARGRGVGDAPGACAVVGRRRARQPARAASDGTGSASVHRLRAIHGLGVDVTWHAPHQQLCRRREQRVRAGGSCTGRSGRRPPVRRSARSSWPRSRRSPSGATVLGSTRRRCP